MQNVLIIENHNISSLIGELHECLSLQIISYSLRSLEGLENAGPVQKLSLNCCKGSVLKSLDQLSILSHSLISLSLKHCRGIMSLKFLNKLTNLKELSLINMRAPGILLDQLKQLQTLRILDCIFNATQLIPKDHKINSLTLGLAEATSLKGIIVPCDKIEIYARKLSILDIDEDIKLFIKDLSFTCVENYYFKQLSGIEKFYNLKKIRIKDVKNLESLNPLMYLSQLEEIQLINVDMDPEREVKPSISTAAEVIITNCGPRIVQSFVYAEKLKLRKVSYTDLSFLINPVYVNYLSIQDCSSFQSLQNISQFKSLQKLEIINCNLNSEGLDGLADLDEQLKELTIQRCDIMSLQFLYDVVHLVSLNLDDNSISDGGELMFLKYLKELRSLSIINNPVCKTTMITDFLLKYLSLTVQEALIDLDKTNVITSKFKQKQKSLQDKYDFNYPQNRALSNLEALLWKKTRQTANLRSKYEQLKKDFIIMENQFQNSIYELKLQIKIAESDLLDGERRKENEWRQWKLCDYANKSSNESDTELENCRNNLAASSDNLLDLTQQQIIIREPQMLFNQAKLSESQL